MSRWKVVAAGLVALGLVAGGARAAGRRFLFPAHRVADLPVPEGPAELLLSARDGEPVHALELPGPPGGRVLVHFHNNSETAVHALPLGRALQARGLGVVLVEYRGYGSSRGGAPTEQGLYLDAEAALDQLARRGLGPERVVLSGTSLGTGVAAEMARRGRGAALVLVTPYTSIPDLVTDVVPLVPARALLADSFDTLAKAAEIRVPTLVIHGDADEVVPFWMGRRLAGAIAGARFIGVPGGHHGDLFGRQGERLLDEIARLAGGR